MILWLYAIVIEIVSEIVIEIVIMLVIEIVIETDFDKELKLCHSKPMIARSPSADA